MNIISITTGKCTGPKPFGLLPLSWITSATWRGCVCVGGGGGGTCCMGNSLSSISSLLRPAPWRGPASAAAVRRHNTKDMKALDRDINGREDFPQDRSHWREELNRNQRRGEEKLQLVSDELRGRHKNRLQAPPADTTFKCSHCGWQGL